MSDEKVLDVRSWPVPERQNRILAHFDNLRSGQRLKVLIEYEPRPVQWRFEESCRHRFGWRQRRLNDGLWEVTIERIVPAEARSIVEFFEECGLLASVRSQTRSTIASYAIRESHHPNAVLVEQDADWPYLGFVRSGCVFGVLTTSTGRDQQIFEVMPHETFAEVTALDGGATAARWVTAGVRAETYVVPRDVIAALIARDGAFAQAIASLVAQRMRAVIARFSAQISRPTIARLAAAIFPYSSPQPGLMPAHGPLRLLNQTQLAIAAGTVKTVANRELAKLEAAGAIERQQGRVVRVDRTKLVPFL